MKQNNDNNEIVQTPACSVEPTLTIKEGNKMKTNTARVTNKEINAMTSTEYGAFLSHKIVIRPVELSDLIRKYVEDSIDGIEDVATTWEKYVDRVAMDSNDHAQYHANLMTQPNSLKLIKVALSMVIRAEATKGNSYIDRNAVAKQIGNKLTKGKARFFYDQDGTYVEHNNHTKLSLGLNVTEFLRREGLIALTSIKSKEGHTIVKLEAGFDIPKSIKIAAAKVRSHMASQSIIDHTPEHPGGYACDPVTMLNSKGFNTVKTQPQLVCDAMNKLQNVEFKLRDDLPSDFLDKYQTDARWEDDNGNFMIGEWNKFITDIQTLNGDPFRFAQAADDRGRLYSRATYVALQGDAYQKSMLRFANKEMVENQLALDYLKVAFCNEANTDKIPVEDAIAWFDSKTDEELDELANHRATEMGDSDAYPALRGILNDYRAALKGEDIGTIVPWDATNQAAQVYAVLSRDMQTALISNIAYAGEREDAYGELATILNRRLHSTIFTRDNVKYAFMTYLYGAGQSMILNGYNDLNGKGDAKTKEQSIGRFFPYTMDDEEKWTIFVDSMKELLPAAVEYMEVIYKFADEKRSKYRWTMPDGFIVETTTFEQEEVIAHYFKLGTSMEPSSTPTGSIFAKRETGVYSSKALAPNIVHSIDSYILREVVRRADFDIVTIHDSYGVHPNNVEKLRQLYREVLISVMEMNLLENILEQINPELAQAVVRRGLLSKGKLTAEMINASEYALR